MGDNTGGAAVTKAVKTLNRAWLDERFDDLSALVHRDIVMVAPGFGERRRGGEAFVAGLRDFMQSAVIHRFVEHDVVADVVADTAVAAYRFAMDYERAGRRYAAAGRDGTFTYFVSSKTGGSPSGGPCWRSTNAPLDETSASAAPAHGGLPASWAARARRRARRSAGLRRGIRPPIRLCSVRSSRRATAGKPRSRHASEWRKTTR